MILLRHVLCAVVIAIAKHACDLVHLSMLVLPPFRITIPVIFMCSTFEM